MTTSSNLTTMQALGQITSNVTWGVTTGGKALGNLIWKVASYVFGKLADITTFLLTNLFKCLKGLAHYTWAVIKYVGLAIGAGATAAAVAAKATVLAHPLFWTALGAGSVGVCVGAAATYYLSHRVTEPAEPRRVEPKAL